MAALLSSEIDDGNKRDMIVDHIADARKLGIDVLPAGREPRARRLRRPQQPHRLRPHRHQGTRPRAPPRRSSAPATTAGSSRTSSTSASASTAASSRRRPSRRWSWPGRSTPSASGHAHFAAVAKAYQAADETGRRPAPRAEELPRPVRRRGRRRRRRRTPAARPRAARRARVARDREAEVREGGARLLHRRATRWPSTTSNSGGSARTTRRARPRARPAPRAASAG